MENDKFQELVLQQFQAMNKQFQTITGELKILNQRVGNLEEGQARMESRIGNLEEGQARMESRIDNLEEGQARMESRIDNLEEGQARMESRMDKLEKSQDILVTEVMAVKSKTNQVNANLTKLAIRIENEIEPKINALFDSKEQHTKQITRIEELVNSHNERLDSIEIDTGYLVSRVARLEKMAN
jgi:chromosome segregation ATPase